MKRAHCLLLVIFLLGICHIYSKTYVVCVGIADYPGTRNDLRISDNDAKTISRIFKTNSNASVAMLLNSQASQSAVISTMQKMFARADSDDTIILFYSGHGTPIGLVCHDGVLGFNRLLDVMQKCKASKKMIFADACYAGKMRSKPQQTNSYTNQNIMLFLSSRTNELSQETRFKNSLFTIFLERGLRGGADANRDRTITAKELYRFVHDGVISASNNHQHPVMWGKFNDNMPIIKW